MTSLLSRVLHSWRPSASLETDTGAPAETAPDTRAQGEPVQGTELLTIDFESVGWLSWSPDGCRLAAAAQGGAESWRPEVKIWEASTGAGLLELRHGVAPDRSDRATTVQFSPDGGRLVTAGTGSAHVWDAGTGEEVLVVRHGGVPYAQLISAAEFAPDGTRIATGGTDCTARIWDLATGDELLRLTQPEEGRPSWVHALAFGSDGSWLATGCHDGLTVNDAKTGEARLWVPTRAPVYRVAASPVGTLLAAVVEHGTSIYDARTWTERQPMPGLWGEVISVAFGPDGARLVTVDFVRGSGCTANVWDMATGDRLAWVHCGYGPAVLSPDGARLATRDSRADRLKIWSIAGAVQDPALKR